jgi:hypothetical protein
MTETRLDPCTNALLGVRNTLLAAAGCALLGTAPVLAMSDPDVPMHRAPSGHYLVPVTIDGEGPYEFIIDTGASHTAVASAVAERFGFVSEWEHYDEVQALTTRFDAEFFDLPNFGYTGREPASLTSVIIPVADGHPIPVAGLLGADAIGSQRYAINFGTGLLELDAEPPVRVDGYVNNSGLLIGTVGMRRDFRTIHVMLDSGSARSIANHPLVRMVGSRRMGLRMGTVAGIDGREEEEVDTLLVRNLQLGGLCFPAMQALEGELDIFRHLGWEDEPAMIIGMDVLQFGRVIVDREAGAFEVAAAGSRFRCG